MTSNFTGFGLGLRPDHYGDYVVGRQPVDWLEILTDNYLVPGGKPLYYLERIRRDYPVVMHGVAMNLGSSDPLDEAYLKSVKALMQRIEPELVSDHLCWTGVNNQYLHDLLPLPYTEEAICHVSERILRVQDVLGRRLTIENVSTYAVGQAPMSEWEFFSAVVEAADCDMLVDINNIYVSGRNANFDPVEYLQQLPTDRIRQFHLAGHSDYGDHCIDTHDQPICEEVWALYAMAIQLHGDVPVMIERDENIPELCELIAELGIARQISADLHQRDTSLVPTEGDFCYAIA